jgi:hypothetical protein
MRRVMARAAIVDHGQNGAVRSERDDSLRRPIADGKSLSMGDTNHDRGARDGIAGIGWKLGRSAIGDKDSVHVAGVRRRMYGRGHASNPDDKG